METLRFVGSVARWAGQVVRIAGYLIGCVLRWRFLGDGRS